MAPPNTITPTEEDFKAHEISTFKIYTREERIAAEHKRFPDEDHLKAYRKWHQLQALNSYVRDSRRMPAKELVDLIQRTNLRNESERIGLENAIEDGVDRLPYLPLGTYKKSGRPYRMVRRVDGIVIRPEI